MKFNEIYSIFPYSFYLQMTPKSIIITIILAKCSIVLFCNREKYIEVYGTSDFVELLLVPDCRLHAFTNITQ